MEKGETEGKGKEGLEQRIAQFPLCVTLKYTVSKQGQTFVVDYGCSSLPPSLDRGPHEQCINSHLKGLLNCILSLPPLLSPI